MTDAELYSELERVLDLPFAPKTDAGKGELLRALQQAHRSDQHARRIIDELVRGERCPTPADVLNTGWSLLSDEEKRLKACGLCIEGWRPVKLRNGYEGVQRCACQGAAPVAAAQEPEKRAGGLTKASLAMSGKDWE